MLLALASLDLNELVLEPVNFDDGDPLERPFSTPRCRCRFWIGYLGG